MKPKTTSGKNTGKTLKIDQLRYLIGVTERVSIQQLYVSKLLSSKINGLVTTNRLCLT